MNHESDPSLDALRAAWAAESTEASMPPEKLADTDDATQAVVGALQDAWRAEATLDAAAAEAALRRRREALTDTRRVRARRVAAWMGVGLAAAAAALLVVPRGGEDLPVKSVPVILREPPPAAQQIQQLTQRPDGVEFRSGGVRVVLVQPMR